jgi:hypothetical protein
VNAPNYSETWVEGMTVFHNPRALIALPPEMIPDANHEFLQPDDSIASLVPEFHPLFSQTEIWVEPWPRRRRWLAAQRRWWVPQRGQKWMLTGPGLSVRSASPREWNHYAPDHRT